MAEAHVFEESKSRASNGDWRGYPYVDGPRRVDPSDRVGPNGSRDDSGRLWLRSALDQLVADQSYGSSLPRVIGAHAKPAVSPRNDRPGAGVADLKSDRVLGSADPPHYANQ